MRAAMNAGGRIAELERMLEQVVKERDELRERLDTVNDTNKLKQMTIQELQRQRGEASAEIERMHKAYQALEKEYDRLKAENLALASRGTIFGINENY